jgi:hypothetical protein
VAPTRPAWACCGRSGPGSPGDQEELNKPGVRDTLHTVALTQPTITHEALDAMPPSGTLAHIRATLVVAGALPPRDERLAEVPAAILAKMLGIHIKPRHH